MSVNKQTESKVITNPLRAIRAKCLDCCCHSAREVALCTTEHCALFHFRFGKNPYRKYESTMTEEQRKAFGQRMKAARGKKSGGNNE